MLEFISVAIAATLLKLSSSIDDSVWLAKLLHIEKNTDKIFIELTYLASLAIITIASYLLYIAGNRIFYNLGSHEALLAVISSLVLIIFSVTYLRIKHEDEPITAINPLFPERIKIAFIISLVGSIDELLLYITAFSTGKIQFFPLLAGTLIAGCIVIMIVTGIMKANFLMLILHKIPVWLIIFSIGMISLLFSVYNGFC